MSALRKICAWCHPGVQGPDITHGICPKHERELLQEAGIGGDAERGPDKQVARLTVHRYDHDTGAMKKVSTYHDTWEEAEMNRRFLKKKLGRSFTGADIELQPNPDHPMHKINPHRGHMRLHPLGAYIAGNNVPMAKRYLEGNGIVRFEVGRATMDRKGWVLWEMSGETTGLPTDGYRTKADAVAEGIRAAEFTGLPLTDEATGRVLHPGAATKINPAGKRPRITISNLVDQVAETMPLDQSFDSAAIREALNNLADMFEKDGYRVDHDYDQAAAVGRVKAKVMRRNAGMPWAPKGPYHENPKGRVRHAHHWKTYDQGEHSGSMELTRGANPRRVRKRIVAQYAPGHAPKLGRIKQGPLYRTNPAVRDGIDPFDRAGLEVAGVRISAWQKPGTKDFIAFIAAAGSHQIDLIKLESGRVHRDSLATGIPLAGLKGWKPVTEVPDNLHRLIQAHVRQAIR